jgi:hypothetical protein
MRQPACPIFLTLPKDEFSHILLDEYLYLVDLLFVLRPQSVGLCREEEESISQ